MVLTARPFLVTPQHHQARLGRSQGAIWGAAKRGGETTTLLYTRCTHPPGSIVCSAAVSQSEGEGVVGTSQELVELNKDTFYDALKDAGNTLVVVDFYTLWYVLVISSTHLHHPLHHPPIPNKRCGPCKAIYPKLLEFRDTYADVLFYKFNCNKANKDLGQQLGIKVAPTFQLYKNGNKVAEITGAKADVLRELIEQHK